jgi:hypothetical protein
MAGSFLFLLAHVLIRDSYMHRPYKMGAHATCTATEMAFHENFIPRQPSLKKI